MNEHKGLVCPELKDVVQRISEHRDADACQSTLDLLREAAAEILILRSSPNSGE